MDVVSVETESGEKPPLVEFFWFPPEQIESIKGQGMACFSVGNKCLGVRLTQDTPQFLTRLPADFSDKAEALGDLLKKLENKEAEIIRATYTWLVIIPKDKDEQSLGSDFEKFGENNNLLVAERLPDGRLVVGMLSPKNLFQASAKPLQR